VSALTAPTRAGRLYDVDMRLRPSGRKGPVATQLSAFAAYQESEAETWERMSLTRARVLTGAASLAVQVEAVIEEALRRSADPDPAKDVREMRVLIAEEKGESDRWDLKLARGGLLDVEFVAQYLILRHHRDAPTVRGPETAQALTAAREGGVLEADDAQTLISAHRLFSAVSQLIRVSVEGKFDPQRISIGVKRRIAAATGAPDISALAADLDVWRAQARAVYEKTLGVDR
jgi:glutamate-ammonia-ligase adenylyltransferase